MQCTADFMDQKSDESLSIVARRTRVRENSTNNWMCSLVLPCATPVFDPRDFLCSDKACDNFGPTAKNDDIGRRCPLLNDDKLLRAKF